MLYPLRQDPVEFRMEIAQIVAVQYIYPIFDVFCETKWHVRTLYVIRTGISRIYW